LRLSMRHSLLIAASLLIAVAAPIAVSRRVVPAGDGATHQPATATSTVTLPATTTSTSTAFGRTPEGSFEIDISVLRTADAPDPFVVMDRHQPWMFATNNKAGNVPMGTTATDGQLLVADAMPQLPPWAIAGFTWAPAVTPTADGWVLAFTARDRASDRQCIGVATAPTVHGPYSPTPEPLVCHPDQGGSIDPSFASDRAGQRWLLYKSDGNCCGLPTTLHAVPLTSAATTLSGPPVDLITAELPWEGGLVEAPTMSQVGDRWLLLYSANRWNTPRYAVGAAWCDAPIGPCHKQPEPALTAGAGIQGPGGVEFASGTASGGAIVTFHAWPDGAVGYKNGSTRRVHLGRVKVTDDAVTITPLL
jgi:arabinan endo-1,5-alpha-L-arabinosidase